MQDFKNQININLSAALHRSHAVQAWRTVVHNYNAFPFPAINPVYLQSGVSEERLALPEARMDNLCLRDGWMCGIGGDGL